MARITRSLAFIVPLVITFVVISLFWIAGLKVNLTNSMPMGIYIRSGYIEFFRNEYISFCLPKPIALVGKERGYLEVGSCPGHVTSLLKTLIALPGDKVILSKNFITVNGVSYFAPQQHFDRRHQSVIRWIQNMTYKKAHGIWVYGSNDVIHSWDSRYYGGIPLSSIQGIYRPLWVFSSKN